MEKHRSFSMKPARSLVFSLAISSSLIFLTVFFICVLKATPPFPHQETPPLHLIPFNQTALLTSAPLLPIPLPPVVLQTLDRDVFWGNLSPRNSNFLPTAGNVDISASRDATHPSTATTANEIRKQVGITSNNNNNDNDDTAAAAAAFALNATNTSNTTTSPITSLDTKLSAVAANNHIIYRKPRKTPLHSKSTCDVTNGMWVFDQSYPLYRNTTCPFIDEGFNCEANGRLDRDYMKWRWQPKDCDIPRFNAIKMLELIRGKRLVFVGDSLNRNQWESMLCLLLGAIKDPKKVYESRGRKITKSKGDYCFKFVDYKCTVEFYVTHFLVHESKARIGKKRVQTLRVDTIDKSSSKWRGADILVFNTAHWWSHHKTKAGVNYYQEGDQIHPRLDVSVALRRALATWASWVDMHVNPRATRVFFRTSAPSHFSGGQWNTGGHCREASQPINTTFGISPTINGVVEEVTRQMKTPVTFLNISGLSGYRIDGHPSVFGRKSEKSSFSGVQDCSHWCLPGVPDSWNELLYYHLLFDGRSSHTT